MTDGLQGFELTDRKAIESRYQRIVDNARTGVLQTTPDGRILTANPAVAQILGFASVEEMMRTAPSMADRYADAGRRDRLLRELKQHGSVAESEVQLRRGSRSTSRLSTMSPVPPTMRARSSISRSANGRRLRR